MDGMRWLLLLIGLLVIGCVYLYSRRAPRSAKKPVMQLRREPTLDSGSATDANPAEMPIADDVPVSDETTSATGADVSATLARQAPQKIVALRIIARGGGAFRGDELILNLRGVGMRHGKFGIFHRFDDPNEEQAIFSAASLIEPGSFDLANIRDQEIPGISLFSVLPGPLPGVEAFDIMMAAARKLAQELNGELLDESGSTLSIQRERYMREEVVQFQHRHKVA
jgi:cell division protein ZipA